MNIKELNQLHADRSNWKAGVFYHCADDPRPVVRSGKVGWTLNCAKPLGWILIALFFGTIIGLGYWMKVEGMSQMMQIVVLLPVIVVWVFIFHLLSSTSRYASE